MVAGAEDNSCWTGKTSAVLGRWDQVRERWKEMMDGSG